MADYDYDLFVIGAGSGGVRAGRLAAQTGAKVAVAEEHRPGGTCVIRGCVPKKYLVYASEYGAGISHAKGYGWNAENVRFHWPTLRDAIQAEVSRLSGIYDGILERNGAELIKERAEFVGPHILRLTESGRTVTAKNILIAVGGWPYVPDFEGSELAITSNEAFVLDKLPESMMIVGGGYIACEFAGIFAGLGVDVTLAYRGPEVLRGFDDDVRAAVAKGLRDQGVEIIYHSVPEKVTRENGKLCVDMTESRRCEVDVLMMATGRAPKTAGLGLEKAGVEVDMRGAIKVDAYSQTSTGHIYAVGDVTNRVNLTPVAIREGAAFVETVFKDNPTAYDHTNIASGVFVQPPVGTVGLSEEQARDTYGEIGVYKTDFRPMNNVLAGSDQRCFMKLITDADTNKVVGVHIVGDHAAEIIQAVGIAVKAGLTKAQFDATCAVHPTLAEELVTL